MILIYTRGSNGPKYYAGYTGAKVQHCSKAESPRLTDDLADKVLLQLTTLGYQGYKKMQETDEPQ